MKKNQVSFVTILIAFTVHALVLVVQAQNNSLNLVEQRARVLNKKFIPKEPVEIVEVKSKGSKIKFGAAFITGEDWVKGLTLKVKNRSEKSIVYLSIDLRVDGTTVPRRRSAVTLSYGSRPTGQNVLEPSSLRPIAPGENVEITLTDALYDDLRSLVQQDGSDLSRALDRAELKIDFIIFDDNSAWGNGRTLRRDPTNPDKWNVVNAEPNVSVNSTDANLFRNINYLSARTTFIALPRAAQAGGCYEYGGQLPYNCNIGPDPCAGGTNYCHVYGDYAQPRTRGSLRQTSVYKFCRGSVSGCTCSSSAPVMQLEYDGDCSLGGL
jgi:hypothetical protein